MKFSLAIAVLILAIGASFGWRDHQQIVAARETQGQLAAEAATLGIAIDPSHPGDPSRITKHDRQNHEVDAKLFATELIAFAKEMEAMEKKAGGQPDEAMQKRIMDLIDRMLSLDSAQLKILITEFRANSDLKDETRQGLIGFSIMSLATDHPQAALALFTESSDLFKNGGMGNHVISSALSRWAKDDPMAALAWVREHANKHPDWITDDTKRGLLTGAAAQDPKLAFKLIGELGLKDSNNAMDNIVRAARTPEERTVTLAALREHLATLTDENARKAAADNAIRNLAGGITQDGFEAASKWLATAKLTPEELASFADGVSPQEKSGETGQWIEWLGDLPPSEKSAGKIGDFVRNWTQNDYQAAGKWLVATPAGATKNTAIRSYAGTIARYEPETAAQWALTLPAGEARDSTLKTIHRNWPEQDPAGAAAFAKTHGIK